MVSTLCPNCRQQNAVGSDRCRFCGAALQTSPLVISPPAPLQLQHTLPPEQVKRIAATLAISLAAVLAEAGLRYLQQRLDNLSPPRLRRSSKDAGSVIVPAQPTADKAQGGNGRVVTVISERVIVERRWGRPTRRVVERFAWRAEEKHT